MSGAIIPSVGTSVAIAAAAAAAAKMRKEEENMTNYSGDDLKGWEFKIVRSSTAYFKKPANLQKVIQEEAQAGWEMVEKFDNNRVRFKRRTDMRGSDSMLEIDAYRIKVGMGEGKLVGLIVGILALALGLVFAVIVLVNGGIGSVAVAPSFNMLVIGVLAAGLLLFAAIAKKGS